MRIIPLFSSLVVVFSCGVPAWADVRLPALFSEHMVIEKAADAPVWGWADPGEAVSVSLGGKTTKTVAGTDGRWMARLNLRDSGPGPFEMTVSGQNTISIRDVVVGEVWLASGQSNMEWPLDRTVGGPEEVAQSANSQIRVFTVERKALPTPTDEVRGKWEVSEPGNSGQFTAVGYYFAKALQRELQAPVGVIHSSWGGSPIEAWMSKPLLESVPDLAEGSARERDRKANFDTALAQYASAMEAWMKQTHREDRPTPDPMLYAAKDVSPEGWATFEVPPGTLPEKFPGNGVIWLRKEFTLPDDASAKPFRLDFKDLGGIETVYWNDKLLNEYTYRTHPGRDYLRRFYIPSGSVRGGRNTLAIRVFAPAEPLTLTVPPKAGPVTLSGPWQVQVEMPLPPLDAKELASLPEPPAPAPRRQDMPSYLFNGMINPLVPYAISGVIWYQGESNTKRAVQYRTALPLMIRDWRALWKEGDFPFLICQLPDYMSKVPEPRESSWAEMREAQAKTALEVPEADLVVLIGHGDKSDIHPRNKLSVGELLASTALARVHGRKIPYSGPVYRSMTIKDGKVRLNFDHTEGGLAAPALPASYRVDSYEGKTAPLVPNSPGSQIEGFQICGQDRVWQWANAAIEGDSVVVSSDKVPVPVAVRYNWADNPNGNLGNGAGLPAGPFRTDDFPLSTSGIKF